MDLYKYSKEQLQEMIDVLEASKTLLHFEKNLYGICWAVKFAYLAKDDNSIKFNYHDLIELCFLYRVDSNVPSIEDIGGVHWWPLNADYLKNRSQTIDKAIHHLNLILQA